jgi:hypothetical protein
MRAVYAFLYTRGSMRWTLGFVGALVLMSPSAASAQSFQLQASAGPTIIDNGYSLAAGGGFTAGSRLSVLIDWERTHISSDIQRDALGRVMSASRGGTLTLATGELRIGVLPRNRVGPYGLAGFALGTSRPNVNEAFPNAVTNDLQAVFFGGGVHVPLGARASLFADARLIFGAEGDDGIVGVVPIRAGLSWRF